MRIVSLVPSLTETLFALGLAPDTIVGRTSWCIEPRGRVEEIRTVGGTKTPSLRAIRELAPDLVLLEKEENRRETAEALAEAGIAFHACHVTKVADVAPMLRELGSLVGRSRVAGKLAARTEEARERATDARRRLGAGPVVAAMIWADPLMVVGADRYSGDLLREAGFSVAALGPGYPRVSAADLGSAEVDVLLLSTEPHDFSREEGAEIADAVAGTGRPRPLPLKVDGQALTWFGARTADSLDVWLTLRERMHVAG